MPDELTRMENRSIRRFVQKAADEGYLSGQVLDVGAGRQPYREIIEAAGGKYVPYDRKHFPANASGEDVGGLVWKHHLYQAVLCTQVVQYVPDEFIGESDSGPSHYANGVHNLMEDLAYVLRKGGHLVLSYPTNWPEVQDVDLHRFTKAGMERLLTEAGFEILIHERREAFTALGYEWAFGYGVVCRA